MLHSNITNILHFWSICSEICTKKFSCKISCRVLWLILF